MKRSILFVALWIVVISAVPALLAQTKKTTRKPQSKTAQSEPTKQADGPEQAPVKEDLKRLVLKDGSYQPVIKYQIIGDRVHYLSAERYTWEDIPSNLIDWDASRKYTEQAAADMNRPRAHQVDAEEEAERQKEEALSPTVSPGIKLPPTGGVFLLDVYQGKPELNELVQNGADVNKNTAGNILRGAINPIASAKQTIELKGSHARIQSHVGDPFIYIAIDQDQDSSNNPNMETESKRWRLVRVEEKKGNRIVGNINIAIYGKVKQKANYIEAEITPVSGPWLKVVPSQKLQAGEYALVELLGDQGINRFVWDFGVNETAPANPGSWKPAAVKANTTGTNDSPVLQQHNP